MGKVFAVISGKGGVGKSSVTLGLGFALSQMGKRVLLVDMDEGLRCLDIMLGLDCETVFDLADILSGNDAGDGIYKYSDNLFLVPAPSEPGHIDMQAFSKFALSAEGMYDAVIFDFPAGIHCDYYKALPYGTQFLTVAVNDPVSVRDAAVLSEKLREISANTRLIINKFDLKHNKKSAYKNIDGIIDASCLRLIGIVPLSREVELIPFKYKLKINCKAAKAFSRIAERLYGENVLLPEVKNI